MDARLGWGSWRVEIKILLLLHCHFSLLVLPQHWEVPLIVIHPKKVIKTVTSKHGKSDLL
jgi:nitrate reductase gamma subunit